MSQKRKISMEIIIKAVKNYINNERWMAFDNVVTVQ